METPSKFKVDDQEQMDSFLREHAFGLLLLLQLLFEEPWRRCFGIDRLMLLDQGGFVFALEC